ncbi:hypothetical protein [Clostridium sp.]|uniref:hypothetical protein n=1 Tax=Clostridium sp. TaxID=1506 RepID=UPI0026314EA9|nr:hypothetical protein [Clostridium sp.]
MSNNFKLNELVNITEVNESVSAIIYALDNLLILKNNSKCTSCKIFFQVDYNIERLKLLVEQLDCLLNEQALNESITHPLVYTNNSFYDFYN